MSRNAFQRCVAKRRSVHGETWDDAAAVCRGEKSKYNPEPLPGKAVQEVGPASSVGPGWRSQGANIGTGAVIEPDAKQIARDWAKAVGTRDRQAWEVHAKRMGCSPEGVEAGWEHLARRDAGKEESIERDEAEAAVATFDTIQRMREARPQDRAAIATANTIERMRQAQAKEPTPDELAALATLRTVFGESVSWTGFWGPTPGITGTKADVDPQVDRKKKRRNEGVNVMAVKTHQAPQDGNIRGQAQIAQQDPGFPFRTRSAQMVWDTAQQLILLYPTSNAGEILQMAVRESGVQAHELAPEDEQLLKMAVEYLQNGSPASNVRTGGAPGGPFRSQGDGHTLGIRGTHGLP